MDRGRRDDDGGRGSVHYPDRDRRRPDARDWIADRGQRDDRDRRDSGGWDRGPRSGSFDGRGGAPRPSDGRQFETRYGSQALQHQTRSVTDCGDIHRELAYDASPIVGSP